MRGKPDLTRQKSSVRGQILRDRQATSAQGDGVVDVAQSLAASGAGFYDGRKAFRGEARLVSKRHRALSELTVIDVVGADAGLASYLAQLDHSRLVVRDRASGDALYTFLWASGYVNGTDIRVQGVLDHA